MYISNGGEVISLEQRAYRREMERTSVTAVRRANISMSATD